MIEDPPRTRWPAEWDRHAATWLAYPHCASDWPGKLEAVQDTVLKIARTLQEFEPVRMLARTNAEALAVEARLRDLGASNAEVLVCQTDRSWLRDSGPTFVCRDGQPVAVAWHFDGWGRYDEWRKDAKVATFIAEAADAHVSMPSVRGRRLCMEGGAIDGNGAGTLLTTEACLLDRSRHGAASDLTREDYTKTFQASLGCESMVWLGDGIAGDDTSGHIDTIARFVGPTTIAVGVETKQRDENYARLRDNFQRLRQARDRHNRPFEIVDLPMPRPIRWDGDRLPATYLNLYIANGCVLVPTFNEPNDAVALRTLATCFPGRAVIGIDSVDLVLGQGTLHCLSQQQPKCDPVHDV